MTVATLQHLTHAKYFQADKHDRMILYLKYIIGLVVWYRSVIQQLIAPINPEVKSLPSHSTNKYLMCSSHTYHFFPQPNGYTWQ